jgi:hypothetical protein
MIEVTERRRYRAAVIEQGSGSGGGFVDRGGDAEVEGEGPEGTAVVVWWWEPRPWWRSRGRRETRSAVQCR